MLSLRLRFLVSGLALSGAARQLPQRGSLGLCGTPVPLPMGEVSPKVTERASPAGQSCHAAISRPSVRAILSLRLRISVSGLALSGATRQLPQRGSLGLCGMQKPLPMGEVAAKQTERASPAGQSCHAAISRPFVRAILSLCLWFLVSGLTLSGAARQLPQRGSLYAKQKPPHRGKYHDGAEIFRKCLAEDVDKDTSSDGRADDAGHVGAHGVHQQEVGGVLALADLLGDTSGHRHGGNAGGTD